MRIGIVAGLVFALLAAAGVAWWLLRDQAPLTGRPRITDKAAGISYGIPEGWKQRKGSLVSPFTSAMGKAAVEDGRGSSVLAGSGGAIAEADLKKQTEFAARSNAEFFYPNGRSIIKKSESTTVSGRAAHTVTSTVEDEEGGQVFFRITIVSVDNTRSLFILGLAQPLGTPEEDDVDAVVDSASLLP